MDENIYENLSIKIAFYKKKLKLINKKIAEIADLPIGTVEHLSAGRTKSPKLSTLKKLCNAFDCTLDELLSNNPENKVQPYYFNEETARLAQELSDNSELRGVCDATRHLKPEALKAVKNMIDMLLSNNEE